MPKELFVETSKALTGAANASAAFTDVAITAILCVILLQSRTDFEECVYGTRRPTVCACVLIVHLCSTNGIINRLVSIPAAGVPLERLPLTLSAR